MGSIDRTVTIDFAYSCLSGTCVLFILTNVHIGVRVIVTVLYSEASYGLHDLGRKIYLGEIVYY